MLLIPCPWCGPRDEAEFHYGGQAHVPYPEDPAALTDEEWARYLFFRDNPKGPFAERWSHAAGCRKWFNAVRNTATNEILAVYKVGEPRPESAEPRPESAEPRPESAKPRLVTSQPGPALPARPGVPPPGEFEDEAVQAEGGSGGAAPSGVERAAPLEDGPGRGGGGDQPFRTPTGGRIARDAPLTFTFDGTEYQGYRGDTLASALLANGVVQAAT
ncbi:sarcosine oxidase subunit delta family protein, partial [Streptomyces spiralis]